MSRQIDLTRPPTEDEIAYLQTRAGGSDIMKVVERKFGDLSEEERVAAQAEAESDHEDEAQRRAAAIAQQEQEDEDSFHPDDVEKVAPLTVRDLKERLKKLGIKYSSEDNKEDLQVSLLEYLDDVREGRIQPAEEIEEDEGNDEEGE